MENKKEKIEDFKTAISSTVRSLSNSEKIEVSFGKESSKSKKNSISLPDLGQINNKLNYNQIIKHQIIVFKDTFGLYLV